MIVGVTKQSTFEAVCNIVSRILSSIPSSGRLMVLNPTNPKEDFSESWDDPNRYVAFIKFIRDFNSNLQSLKDARGIHNVKTILQSLFGEEVAKTVVEDQIARLGEARRNSTLAITGAGTLSRLVPNQGVQVPKHTYHGS
jgi:hypothetical protein